MTNQRRRNDDSSLRRPVARVYLGLFTDLVFVRPPPYLQGYGSNDALGQPLSYAPVAQMTDEFEAE